MYLSTAGKRHFSDIIETSRSILIEVYFLLHLIRPHERSEIKSNAKGAGQQF